MEEIEDLTSFIEIADRKVFPKLQSLRASLVFGIQDLTSVFGIADLTKVAGSSDLTSVAAIEDLIRVTGIPDQ